MADGYFPTLVSKDENANALANPLLVELSDGTSAVTVSGGSLSVLVSNGSGGSAVNIQDGGNAITVDGTVAATQSGTWNIGTLSTITNVVHVDDNAGSLTVDGTVAATQSGTWNIGTLSTVTNVVHVDDNSGSLTVDGTVGISGSVTVTATALDIRALTLAADAVKVSANTSANSAGNPIFVSFTQAPIAGEVHDYNTAAVTTNDNHDYTVVTAMLLKSIEFASSGGSKVELKVGPVGTLVSKGTWFVPKQGGNVQVKFDPPIEVPVTSTGTVRLVRTNREGSAQSIYSTIIGIDA